jgi:HicA toxin of bacterial toxin-antitoxin,
VNREVGLVDDTTIWYHPPRIELLVRECRKVSTHDRTLEAIFATPARANIRWSDAVNLLVNFGCIVTASGGSASTFTMPNGARAVIHKPHPGNQLSKGRVRAFRELLVRAGLEPIAPPEPADQENGHVDNDL